MHLNKICDKIKFSYELLLSLSNVSADAVPSSSATKCSKDKTSKKKSMLKKSSRKLNLTGNVINPGYYGMLLIQF